MMKVKERNRVKETIILLIVFFFYCDISTATAAMLTPKSRVNIHISSKNVNKKETLHRKPLQFNCYY